MEWKYKKKWSGSIHIDRKVGKMPGYKRINNFLESLFQSFAEKNTLFYSYTEDWAFAYGEQQLHSVLLPAMGKITNACFREQPVNRQHKGIKSYGRLDYWAVFENYPILIEVKHSFVSPSNKTVNRIMINRWEVLKKQLSDIKKTELKNFKWKKELIYKVGLFFCIPKRTSKTEEKSLITSQLDLEGTFQNIIDRINPQWAGCWLINHDQNYAFLENDRYTFYPGVFLLSQIDIIKLPNF